MIYCLVLEGVVINRAVFDAEMPDGWAGEGDVWIADDEAQIGWTYDGEFHEPPFVPGETDHPPQAPNLYAVALLTISDGEISGIDVASKFSAALWLDVGLYYLFFAETQPDTAYLAKAYDDATVVRVVEKAAEYIVVTAADGSGNPVDPAEISVEIIRVK